MRIRVARITVATAFSFFGLAHPAYAHQIAPMSSAWEEKLTREPTSTRAKIAASLGRLIKSPVHEEITQLAMGCTTPDADLPTNTDCANPDAGFATQFINYGVRWNDLPPFRLEAKEGRRCTKLFGTGQACNVAQTIRFSTQPECWYCMFTSAERIAATGRKIVGCIPQKREKGSRVVTANLLARSHYGDLQFLHSMAQGDGLDPTETRADVLGWLEFAWKVSTREIAPSTLLKNIDVTVIKNRFHCSGWSVADLYVLGRQDSMLPFIHDIAFGSVLHTVQDSFAEGHVEREAAVQGESCSTTLALPRPGRIREFHGYAGQDGKLHDAKDVRDAMSGPPVSSVLQVSKQLALYYGARTRWAEVQPYLDCIFALSEKPAISSPGDRFRRR